MWVNLGTHFSWFIRDPPELQLPNTKAAFSPVYTHTIISVVPPVGSSTVKGLSLPSET